MHNTPKDNEAFRRAWDATNARWKAQTKQQTPDTVAAALWIRAQWHRAQSRDFLNNSVQSMRQHEQDAERLEKQAEQLTREAMQ